MAVAVACRQWGQSGTHLGISRFRRLGVSTSVYDPLSASLASVRQLDCMHICKLVKSKGKRLFLFDTLVLFIHFLMVDCWKICQTLVTGKGVPSKQSEAITTAIIEVLNDSLENVSHPFVSNKEMQKMSVVNYLSLEDTNHPLSIGDDFHSWQTFNSFFEQFTRNANLVAYGVARNIRRRVGNSIKEIVDDIVYPYRNPPK